MTLTLSEFIKILRIKNKISSIEMAQKLNVSYSGYIKKELGNGAWKFEEVVKLSQVFGVSLEEFARYID